MLTQVNLIAVIIAGMLHLVVGMLWYSSFLFGKLWQKEAKIAQSAPKITDFIAEYVVGFVIAFFLASLVSRCQVVGSPYETALMAFWVWFGFVATIEFSSVIWSKTSLRLFLICAGGSLASFLTMGAFLGYWGI